MVKYPPETWSIEPPNDSVGIIARALSCPDCDGTGRDREDRPCSACGGKGTRPSRVPRDSSRDPT